MSIFDKLKTIFSNKPSINPSSDASQPNHQSVLSASIESLENIDSMASQVKSHSQPIYLQLLLFTAYYRFIIEFYQKNLDKIVSVGELMLLKYITMVFQIISDYDFNVSTPDKDYEIIKTLDRINSNLFSKVKNIKANVDMNMVVDLKTIRDLSNFDF